MNVLRFYRIFIGYLWWDFLCNSWHNQPLENAQVKTMSGSPDQTRNYDSVRAVEWTGSSVKLLDQRILPAKTEYLELFNIKQLADAIRDMVVRGAPAIGITAAYGVVLGAMTRVENNELDWSHCMDADLQLLVNARPTAVNLAWAVERMRRVINEMTAGEKDISRLLLEAEAIHQEDIQANHSMALFGADLIQEKSSVLTHCNTGSLATGGYGTALGVIRKAYELGRIDKVYADETRPWLQGSRLTAWELVQDHIPVVLLADGAAAYLMQKAMVKYVIVGADRITANGDVANKIGTYNLAVNARQHNVKFIVVAPTSTLDMSIASGQDIPIEMRQPQEVTEIQGHDIAAVGADAWNPAFDITPAVLIDYIVTENGVVAQPNQDKLMANLKNGAK